MLTFRTWLLGLLVAMGCAGAGSGEALARCAKLGFSVNDYGKDGPTRDAKALLDKHIAKWTADRGITKYTAGKKSVNCNLFLDFGLFDEHTCKAEATICWSDKQGATPAAAPAVRPAAVKPMAPKASTTPAPAKSDKPEKSAVPAPEKATSPSVEPVPASEPGSGLPKAPPPVRVRSKAA